MKNTCKRIEWCIADTRLTNCAVPYSELERAVYWKKYLEKCCPENGPYIIHGIEVEVNVV